MNALTGMPTDASELASQFLVHEMRLSGPIARAAQSDPAARIMLRYEAGGMRPARHMAGPLCWSAEEPTATWRIGSQGGALTVMSFVAAWNDEVMTLDGHAIDVEIEPGATLGVPFACWHPSGLLQAVRFDMGSGKFVRRLLYPVAGEAARHALVANLGDEKG